MAVYYTFFSKILLLSSLSLHSFFFKLYVGYFLQKKIFRCCSSSIIFFHAQLPIIKMKTLRRCIAVLILNFPKQFNVLRRKGSLRCPNAQIKYPTIRIKCGNLRQFITQEINVKLPNEQTSSPIYWQFENRVDFDSLISISPCVRRPLIVQLCFFSDDLKDIVWPPQCFHGFFYSRFLYRGNIRCCAVSSLKSPNHFRLKDLMTE